ncbi:hypothetical protein D7B24_006300 [Verticillium nonalfalfae]|uniref:Acetylxylan esterase 2 n=1 Tax=Verticillium nonalfalfae TaxID=1051616 RepID=A0A3M9YBA7_9PEZI|nr:uncharacterized protein D7B24_006300 [Verticillium nonalfalfae]RNJ57262.1 hypothetical protein D7B24_006300 [Verticillium nonalfalfae]
MKSILALPYFVAGAVAGGLDTRQSGDSNSCPQIHILGAREPTAPAGLGSTQGIVQLLLDQFPSSTAEAIDYPAEGGDAYGRSVTAGLRALLNQTQAVMTRCPETKFVLVGYSMGAQIIDDAMCGGPDPPSLITDMIPMSPEMGEKVVATLWMGNPRFFSPSPYSVGSAKLGGFAAREQGFVCATYAERIQSYCDERDPYCSKGSSDLTHQNYAYKYGSSALNFVKARVMADASDVDMASNESTAAATETDSSAEGWARPPLVLSMALGMGALGLAL